MNPDSEILRQLAMRLRELARQPLTNDRELQEWNAQADSLRSWMEDQPSGVFDTAYHFVVHYLDDVDIRFRDHVYRSEQNSRLEELLHQLEEP